MQEELSSNQQTLKGIVIPPCPEAMTSIMREAKRPDVDFGSVASLISRDAGLVGPLLKLANSPFVGLKSKVSSVMQAMSVLGMQNTLNLVQNIALRLSLGGESQRFEKFWERSSLTASIAEKIAARFPSQSKNDAYLAALFKDCGIPVLMMKYPQYQEQVKAQFKPGIFVCDIENALFFTSHAVVGNMLTRNWMLPAHISRAILYHHDPTIFASAAESREVYDLIGILHMAECITDEHLHVNEKEWPRFERDVLHHFEMSAQEFAELKDDILAVLNGE